MDKQLIYYSDGQPVEVSQDVFKCLIESDNKIRYFEYDLKVERIMRRKGKQIPIPGLEESLERLLELHIQFADELADVMGEVQHTLMLDKLRHCLTLLDAAELALIQALYFENYTEREYAEKTGVYRNAVHKRKVRI